MSKIIIKSIAFSILLVAFAPRLALAWTFSGDFEAGTIGALATGNSSALTGPFATKFSDLQAYSGSQSAMLDAIERQEGFGHWGGSVTFPQKLYKGNEIWIRLRTFFPTDFNYTANPRLKFLRTHISKPDGLGGFTNGGYNDIYINPPGSAIPFFGIKEQQDIGVNIGTASNAIVLGAWETYECYIKFDEVSMDSGGGGVMRFWKNGILLKNMTNIRTLNTADSYADFFYLFSYWNSDPYTRMFTVENQVGTFISGEMLHGTSSVYDFKLQNLRTANLFEVYDTTRQHVPNFIVGETLTGLTSGATGVVSAISHQYPIKSQNMFIDDMILTTELPANHDASGNAMIGVSDDVVAPSRPSGISAD